MPAHKPTAVDETARAKQQQGPEPDQGQAEQLAPAPVRPTHIDPRLLRPRDVMNMQRTLGNRSAQSLLGGIAQRTAAPENRTGLPDDLKSGVEALSGMALDDVRVHANSGAPAQVGAAAYAEGADIHLAPGAEPHLAHEAWHVVQQKQGRVSPTFEIGGVGANANPQLEREADAMAANVRAGLAGRLPSAAQAQRSAQLLGQPAVQRAAVRQFKWGNATPQEALTFSEAERMEGDKILEKGEITDVQVALQGKNKGAFKYVQKQVQEYRILDDQYVWYHGTTQAAAENIVKVGLDPNYGGSLDTDVTAENSKKHTYFFPTKTNAGGYAKVKFRSKATVLAVRLPKGTIITVDPEIPGGPAVRTATAVPAGNIEDVGL